MAVIITGTPGTGKSTLAVKLQGQLNWPIINITELLESRGLDSEWDEERNCFLVDVVELTKILNEELDISEDLIIDGHLAHYTPPERVDNCFVTKCDLKELKKRLEERDYDEQKVRENLDCEIFDVCYHEAIEQGHNPEVVWTDEE